MGRTPEERPATFAAAALCTAIAVARAIRCHTTGRFVIDDVWLFAKARTVPLWQDAFEPTGVHPGPLHRV